MRLGGKHLSITVFSHQPVFLPFGPFYKSKSETCCRKCKQSYLNFYLCYSQIQQKEECMRVWTGTQWWGCLDSNVCNPDGCACPSASITALTQLTPIPLLFSLSQLHKLTLLRNLFSYASAEPGWLQCRCRCCCRAGTSLQRAGGSQGLRQPTPLHQNLLKPVHQSPEVLFFREIPLSFSTTDSAGMCRSSAPNSGKCGEHLQG